MCDTLSTNHINTLLKTQKRDIILPKDETDTGLKESSNEIDLTIDSERLKTFKDFNSPIPPEDLVKVGFYYSNSKAKCAFCATEISFSQLSESPLDDHLKWSPSCPFARAKKGQRAFTSFLRALPPNQDVCGNVDTYTDSIRTLSQIVYPYESVNARLESFENWPTSAKLQPQVLAEAGFYYKGISDKTVCFRCNIALHGWEDDDDPWEQHALWFPQCKFLLEEKGQGFINEVQRKYKGVVPTDGNVIDTEAKQNDPIDQDKMCLICCNNQRQVVFVPCGHDWTCLTCMRSLEDKKCPICREIIVNVRNL